MGATKSPLSEEARVFGTHPKLKELVREGIVLQLTGPRGARPNLPTIESSRFAHEIANRITSETVRQVFAST